MGESEWEILNICLVRLIDSYYCTFYPPPALRLDFRLVLLLDYPYCLLQIAPITLCMHGISQPFCSVRFASILSCASTAHCDRPSPCPKPKKMLPTSHPPPLPNLTGILGVGLWRHIRSLF